MGEQMTTPVLLLDGRTAKIIAIGISVAWILLGGTLWYLLNKETEARILASANKLVAEMADKCMAKNPKSWAVNAGKYLGPKIECNLK